MKFILFLFLFFSTLVAEAEPHHKGTISSINVGGRYSSLIEKRGVILYRDFQVDPIFAVFFLDDRVEFLGDSIGYRDFIEGDKIRLRTRLSQITDDPLYPENKTIRKKFVDREDTYEWTNSLEIFFPGYNNNYLAELNLSYSKDLKVHHGNYLELTGKTKITDWSISSAHIEPNFVASVGWGDASHNQYFYGPSDNSPGFNNVSYGIWLAFPDEADRNYPIVQITRFSTIGKSHRQAEFSKGENQGVLFSFIATFGLLE